MFAGKLLTIVSLGHIALRPSHFFRKFSYLRILQSCNVMDSLEKSKVAMSVEEKMVLITKNLQVISVSEMLAPMCKFVLN